MTRAAMAGAARLWRYCSRPDWLLTAAALVIMLSTSVAGDSWQLPAGWAAVVVVLSWLPLTVRASWPLPVLAAVLAADTVHIALAGHAHPAAGTLPAATMLALYTVATRYPARVAWTAAAAAGVIQFTVALVSYPHAGPDLLYLNWAVVATALGLLIRERRERIAAAEQRAEAAEHSRQAEADRQVTAERIRIAHELHDVLAHHIAVVNAQAGVAQYLLRTDPAAADTALAGIAANSRAALDELRATLGLLRAEGDAATGRPPRPRPDDRAPRPAPGQFHRRRHAAHRRRPGRTRLPERTGRPRVLPDRAGGPHQRHQARSRQRRLPRHRLVRRIGSPHRQQHRTSRRTAGTHERRHRPRADRDAGTGGGGRRHAQRRSRRSGRLPRDGDAARTERRYHGPGGIRRSDA